MLKLLLSGFFSYFPHLSLKSQKTPQYHSKKALCLKTQSVFGNKKQMFFPEG